MMIQKVKMNPENDISSNSSLLQVMGVEMHALMTLTMTAFPMSWIHVH